MTRMVAPSAVVIAGLAVVILVSPAATVSMAQHAVLTVHIVDRGQENAPLPGADVSIRDKDGKELAIGITNGAGDYTTASVQAGQHVTVNYQKLGYVRHPSTVSVDVPATGITVPGPLVQEHATPAYYTAVAAQIAKLVRAQTNDADRNRVLNDELSRVKTLGPEEQTTVNASLPADVPPNLPRKLRPDGAEPPPQKNKFASKTGKSRSIEASATKGQEPAAKGMVWVNLNTKVFHREGDHWYGKTKNGQFMTEADALKAGYREAKPSGQP